MSSQDDFQLFTTLRYDRQLLGSDENTQINANKPSPFHLLTYHRDRMLHAALNFGWEAACIKLGGSVGLEHLGDILAANFDIENQISPLRIKVVIDSSGDITIQSSHTPPKSLCNILPSQLPPPTKDAVPPLGSPSTQGAYEVLVDTAFTTPSEFTKFKTTKREMYDDARRRVAIASMTDEKEVLLINIKEEVMEGSLTNVIFWRKGRWITPPLQSGGQAGTTRRWLLEKGMVEEDTALKADLVDGEVCWLSNGLRGLIPGRINLKSSSGQT